MHKILHKIPSSTVDSEKYLRLIEKEAVVHALLERVSGHLDPKCPNEANNVSVHTYMQKC